jgi:hypothetical protein
MTKRLEGNNSSNGFGSLWQTLPDLQALWVTCSEAREQLHSAFVANAIALGFEKLNTYFEMLIMESNVSFYAAATALNPALHLNWFQNHWKNFPLWVRKAQQSMKKLFKEYVSSKAEANDEQRWQQSSQPAFWL